MGVVLCFFDATAEDFCLGVHTGALTIAYTIWEGGGALIVIYSSHSKLLQLLSFKFFAQDRRSLEVCFFDLSANATKKPVQLPTAVQARNQVYVEAKGLICGIYRLQGLGQV